MRHWLSGLCILMFVGVALTAPMPGRTHELLPKGLKEYIAKHPNATPAEIKKFLDDTVSEYATRFPNALEVMQMVKNQNTSFLDNAYDFIKLGIEHILTGPDHILFILSLLLVFRTLKDILKLTGTFTISHSITLLLAGAGLLVLPSRLVEPLIALSIAYVALTSVFLQHTRFARFAKEKAAAVFFFGLFHGLGFAGLLKEIQVPADRFLSSLVAFNVGIELGQMIVVASVLPLIYRFRDLRFYPVAIKCASLTFGGIAIFWAIQRTFF